MARNKSFLALDVGEKRIGVALASNDVRIAVPFETIGVDEGKEFERIRYLIGYHDVDMLIVGYPRNQSGGQTAQTAYVEAFVEQLGSLPCQQIYQDESLTSVRAEEILKARKKPYQKGDIDELAASLILQDYLEYEAR